MRVVSAVPLHGVGDGVTNVTFLSLASGLVEENVGLSDDLVGEVGEGNSPFGDLGLELRVDGGSVDHVDRTTGVLDDTALFVEADVKSAKVLAPPVCGDNEDLFTVQVLLDRGVGTLGPSEVSEGGVGVAADDEVETLGALGEFLVLIITDVGHGDDVLGQLLLLDVVDGFLNGIGDVEEVGSGAGLGDRRGGLSGNTDDSEVVLVEDLVWLDVLHEVGIVALDVGTDGREGQILQLGSKAELDEIR